MANTFIYRVGNYQTIDNTAFSKGWKDACHKAAENHCAIYRTVVADKETRHEFFANGGAFLNMRFFSLEKLRVF